MLNELTLDYLREYYRYEPETGKLFIVKSFHKRFIGKELDALSTDGYYICKILGKRYRLHRVIWFYVTGAWPKNFIDHIDHNTINNRFENLRDVTCSQNMMNGLRHRDNLSGIKGVNFHNSSGTWRAKIQYGGKEVDLGHFYRKEDAAKAYEEAARKYHGEFAKID